MVNDDLLEVAYLAGMIDADGFISAHKTVKDGKRYCSPLIGITGTSDEPHRIAKARWGGSLATYKPRNEIHRPQFMWQSSGKNAYAAISALQPFLRIKTKQAALAMEMWDLIASGIHRSDDRLLEIAIRISRMNIRNPPKKKLMLESLLSSMPNHVPATAANLIPAYLHVRQFPEVA